MITPQKFFIKQARRFGFALSGLRYAIRTDKSFRLQWYGLGIVVSTILAILMPLTRDELLFIVGTYILILITELQNSALEYALDHLHPDTHENIGRSKDMAAAAVLLAGLLLLIVLGTITYSRLFGGM
jgi:diacylglycerol kinase